MWVMPAALVTAGAMSVFALLRNKLHFKVILFILTPILQHSVPHFTISWRSLTELLTALLRTRLSRQAAQYMAFLPCVGPCPVTPL